MNEQESARIIGGLEFLAGAGMIVATCVFGREMEEAKAIGYILGTGAIADGGADLISGRIGYLVRKALDLGSYISKNLKQNKKYGDEE